MKNMIDKYKIIFQTAKVGLWEEDYSEIKRFVEDLKKQGVKDFRAFFNKHENEVIRLAKSIKILDVNNEVLNIHGASSKEELLGSLEKITLPEAFPVFKDAIISIAEGKDSFEAEVPGLTLDGKRIHTIIRFIIPKKFKEFKNLIVSTIDITERKRLEEELKNSHKRYLNIFQSALVSIWEEDYTELFKKLMLLKEKNIKNYQSYIDENPDFIRDCINSIKFIDANPETLRLYKATSKEELLNKARFTFSKDAYEDFKQLLLHILQGKKKFERISSARDLKGNKLTIKLNITLPTNMEEAQHVIISIIDLTAYEKMEEQLRTAQKLESLGLLAGGLAHDFNNILTAILGNVSLLRLNITEQEHTASKNLIKESVELIDEAEKSVLKAKSLTQQLLTFAKGGMPVKKITDMAKLIEETATFAASGSNTPISCNIAKNLWNAEVDESQISQVISNIIINAKEALSGEGIIEIEAHNIEEKEPDNKPYIVISIRDNGPGIPKKYVERIFEPYFTTKTKGHGLGLAVAYSIIKKHNGSITVKTAEGKGATFKIFLKAIKSKKKTESHTRLFNKKTLKTKRPGHWSPKRQSILIMDDKPEVRNILSRLLVSIGYDTQEAEDGEKAIKLYLNRMAHGNPFSAVIMDLTIPGKMGGKEAVKKLLSFDPNAKVIVSSGYSDDPVLAHYRDYGFTGILKKPYTLDEITETLKQIL